MKKLQPKDIAWFYGIFHCLQEAVKETIFRKTLKAIEMAGPV